MLFIMGKITKIIMFVEQRHTQKEIKKEFQPLQMTLRLKNYIVPIISGVLVQRQGWNPLRKQRLIALHYRMLLKPSKKGEIFIRYQSTLSTKDLHITPCLWINLEDKFKEQNLCEKTSNKLELHNYSCISYNSCRLSDLQVSFQLKKCIYQIVLYVSQGRSQNLSKISSFVAPMSFPCSLET